MAFPLVHSDEIWLKGIALRASEFKSIWVTESFFDLYPRTGHPFRWFYVLIQSISLDLLGNSVFAVRFVSLIFATIAAYVFYKILKHLNYPSILGSLIFMFNINFIYSAHMGRQETAILASLVTALYAILKWQDQGILKSALLPNALIFIAIGIHPNAFILGFSLTCVMLYQYLSHQRSLTSLLTFVLSLSLAFSLLVLISSLNHPHFFWDYLNYGASLGLDHEPGKRLYLFVWYFIKLFQQVGGTYDLMNIKVYMILTVVLILSGKPKSIEWVGLVTTALAFFILGRNNSLAIVLFLPWMILLFFKRIHDHRVYFSGKQWATYLTLALLIIAIINTYNNLSAYNENKVYQVSYEDMIDTLQTYLPDDALVLGNLNIADSVSLNAFYDIRNLGYLEASQTTLEDYIQKRHINYIVLHEDMSYIKMTSPTWDFLYVNTDYFDSLETYIEENCIEVITFENPLYGMRIAEYTGTYPWHTTIYQVKP